MKRLCGLVLTCFVLSGLDRVAWAQKVDLSERPVRTERSREFDAIHYRIEITLDAANKTFRARNTITLEPFRDGFSTCLLDAETFRVTAVHDAAGKPLEFEQTPHQLAVHLSRAYGLGERVEFSVSYFAEDPQVDSEKYGLSKDYRLGLDFKEATVENPALVSTLSFPTGARHWFPCYDHPNDKVTSDILITVREDYSALANGRLVGITADPANKTRTHHWAQDKPHSTYLFVLVAGPYEVIEDSLGDLPIHYWVYPKDRSNARRSFAKTPEIIAFFNETYGVEYPWAKYDQVTIPGIGGGSESTTATVIGHSTIHDAAAEQDFPSAWLVAHEAAHQWWGDLVTLRDWGHTWINEGFATYGEYLYSAHSLGPNEGALNLLEKKNAYLHEARTRYVRPIVSDRWRFPNDNFDRHTYQKAAAVLHMLRDVLGDGPFFRVHKAFLERHRFGSVDTHDFLNAIKETTGRNLGWFFDQWLYSPGHPVLEIAYSWDARAKKLRLTIEQKQDASGGVPVFRMPVDIGIVTSQVRRSERVWLRQRTERFVIDCATKPLMVRFDEGNVLLKEWRFEKSIAELVYQSGHDDALGRIWAVEQLSNRLSEPAAVAALLERAGNDPFWAVRRSAVDGLSRVKIAEHAETFQRAGRDEKSKVRASAYRALGALQRTTDVEFLKRRFETDDSYVARAAAIRAIGACGGSAVREYLERATRVPSHRNLIRDGAREALAKARP